MIFPLNLIILYLIFHMKYICIFLFKSLYKNEVFYKGFLQYIWKNLQFPADMVKFIKEILKVNESRHTALFVFSGSTKDFFSIDIAWRKSVWLPHIAHIEIHYRNGSRVRLICPITKLSFLKKIDTFYEKWNYERS